MKHNMGSVDRLVRGWVIAPVLTVLSVTVFDVASVLGIVAPVFAGIMVTTGVVGFCPTYTLFGISTRGGISTNGHVHFGGHSRVEPQH